MASIKVRIEGDNTIVIANENTTIGYATIDTDGGEISYIFVNPAFRRRGFGSMLVNEAEDLAGQKLKPADPISPLGKKFFANVTDRVHLLEAFETSSTGRLQGKGGSGSRAAGNSTLGGNLRFHP